MERQILRDFVGGMEISTTRTDAGGATPYRPVFSIFSSSDYDDLNAWPFETMVFREGSRVGLYHEPYSTEQAARDGHARVVESVSSGTISIGYGVQGSQGTPSLTPEQWEESQQQMDSKAK